MLLIEILTSNDNLTKSHFELLLTSRLETLELDWLVDWPLEEKDEIGIAKVVHLISKRCPVKKKSYYFSLS